MFVSFENHFRNPQNTPVSTHYEEDELSTESSEETSSEETSSEESEQNSPCRAPYDAM